MAVGGAQLQLVRGRGRAGARRRRGAAPAAHPADLGRAGGQQRAGRVPAGAPGRGLPAPGVAGGGRGRRALSPWHKPDSHGIALYPMTWPYPHMVALPALELSHASYVHAASTIMSVQHQPPHLLTLAAWPYIVQQVSWTCRPAAVSGAAAQAAAPGVQLPRRCVAGAPAPQPERAHPARRLQGLRRPGAHFIFKCMTSGITVTLEHTMLGTYMVCYFTPLRFPWQSNGMRPRAQVLSSLASIQVLLLCADCAPCCRLLRLFVALFPCL